MLSLPTHGPSPLSICRVFNLSKEAFVVLRVQVLFIIDKLIPKYLIIFYTEFPSFNFQADYNLLDVSFPSFYDHLTLCTEGTL